jgi:uncharacterized protein with PIN domain
MKATCKHCDSELFHVHDTAPGTKGIHEDGTERYECRKCGNVYYKEEGEEMGLKFALD